MLLFKTSACCIVVSVVREKMRFGSLTVD